MRTSAAAAAVSAGSIVASKYRVERLLGEGGMGAVYAARNTMTGKAVAIKWMRAEIGADPGSRARFLREAQASARVRDPHVVDVYDVVEQGDELFLVMELLEGEPLSALISRGDAPVFEVIMHLIGAMRGVAAAHRQHVIHRDVKPDNIFLAREGGHIVAKVVDFGISKITDGNEPSMTSTGAAIGTPLYMSYEQLLGVKDIDVRTDVYAFGVILYEAIAGRHPLMAENYPQLIAKILADEVPPLREARPSVPVELAKAIDRATAKDRTQRTPSLEILIREIEPFASSSGFPGQTTIAAMQPARFASTDELPGATSAVASPSAPGQAESRSRADAKAIVTGTKARVWPRYTVLAAVLLVLASIVWLRPFAARVVPTVGSESFPKNPRVAAPLQALESVPEEVHPGTETIEAAAVRTSDSTAVERAPASPETQPLSPQSRSTRPTQRSARARPAVMVTQVETRQAQPTTLAPIQSAAEADPLLQLPPARSAGEGAPKEEAPKEDEGSFRAGRPARADFD